MDSPTDVWNSLEVVKIIVGILTPVSVVVIGLWINTQLKKLDHSQWVNQKVIDRRLKLFDEMAPQLNDLVCYFTYVGCWKDLKPEEVIGLKRNLDKLAHVYAPLFNEDFIKKYNSFVGLCYESYTGWGNDAKLRTNYKRRKEAAGDDWRESWKNLFSEKDIPDPSGVKKEYTHFMHYFASELDINLNGSNVNSGRVPLNIE